MLKKLVRLLLLLTPAMLVALPAAAQNERVVTVALPGYWEMLLNETVFEPFEAQAGVRVQPVFTDQIPARSAYDSEGVSEYLAAAVAYAASADVVYVNSANLSPEATRTGTYLDLAPLADADPALNREDFYPAVWDSFRWDGGQWALPVSATPLLLRYDQQAFDLAGIPYPTPGWTMEDLARAARDLAERDASGAVTLPGVVLTDATLPALLYSLTGENYYDEGATPTLPDFAEDALSGPLQIWRDLLAEGVIENGPNERIDEIPIQIGEPLASFTISFSSGSAGAGAAAGEAQMISAYLPGGMGGLNADGFAVSGGTADPETAYQLARYLSQLPEIAAAAGGEPARRSLTGVEAEAGPTQIIDPTRINRTPETQALIEDVLQNGIPAAELRFSGYLNTALAAIREGVDPLTALRDAEASAVPLVQGASDHAGTPPRVATPQPQPQLAGDEIALKFGYTSFATPLPNQAVWDQVIADFVEQDPQVGAIELVTTPASYQERLNTTDCFYSPQNLAGTLTTADVFPVEPLLAADPALAGETFIADALAQAGQNGQALGLPLTIPPQMLRYRPDLFAAAGLPEPYNGWTIDEFINALNSLQPLLEPGTPAFSPAFGNSHLLLLIAALGGLPVDFNADAARVDFTSPQTVEAVRTVLDLAKAGIIDYQPLAGPAQFAISGEQSAPLAVDTLSLFGPLGPGAGGADAPRPVSYPVGRQYTPTAYDTGTGYISAGTPYPEACYRWLSHLARSAHVLPAMPALSSMLDDPALAAARGQETIDTYRSIAQALNQPNAVRVPTRPTQVLTWLNQAFDAYVLEDAVLEDVLADAQARTETYLTCTGQIDPALDGEARQQEIDRCFATASA